MIAAGIPPLLLAAIGLLLMLTASGYVISRGKKEDKGPDIPNAFKPGPSDAQLEKPRLERLQAWGIVVLAVTAIWIPVYFVLEPAVNQHQEERLIQAAIEHGSHEVQVFDAHSNPGGVGCVSCHGTDLKGQDVMKGGVVFHSANLTTACSRLTQNEIRQTIKEGRGNMPNWGVEYNGPLNDQQVNDLVTYLADFSKDTVPFATNKCLNPKAALPPASPSATPSGDAASPTDASPTPAA